jgi:hypothetical protein
LLDTRSPAIVALAASAQEPLHPVPPLTMLRHAHRRIAESVHPVYSLTESRPASRVLARGRGSCSQRFAVLEAVARASGVATRSHGIVVDGEFWYARFPRAHALIPDEVVLAWPEFRIDGAWISASELFGDLGTLADDGEGFANRGGETLFEAVSRTAVDWSGATACGTASAACDLSASVVRDLGYFDSRDELFAIAGQTICRPARWIAAPMERFATAGSARR